MKIGSKCNKESSVFPCIFKFAHKILQQSYSFTSDFLRAPSESPHRLFLQILARFLLQDSQSMMKTAVSLSFNDIN